MSGALTLELTLPEKVADRLTALARTLGITLGPEARREVIRRALSVYDTLVTARAEGCAVLVRQPDGRTEEPDLLLGPASTVWNAGAPPARIDPNALRTWLEAQEKTYPDRADALRSVAAHLDTLPGGGGFK